MALKYKESVGENTSGEPCWVDAQHIVVNLSVETGAVSQQGKKKWCEGYEGQNNSEDTGDAGENRGVEGMRGWIEKDRNRWEGRVFVHAIVSFNVNLLRETFYRLDSRS